MFAKLYRIAMKLQRIKCGKRLKLKGIPLIINKKNAIINIGDNCIIKSSFLSNLIGLYSRTIIVTRIEGARILIGDNVGISGATIYARKEIIIGDNTNIGGNVKILDNDFHPLEVNARLMNDSSQIGTSPIHIGKNCFIGCNALVLKGTYLGDNCIVGAGAVVSGHFEDNCIIAGNPAKIIRRLE